MSNATEANNTTRRMTIQQQFLTTTPTTYSKIWQHIANNKARK